MPIKRIRRLGRRAMGVGKRTQRRAESARERSGNLSQRAKNDFKRAKRDLGKEKQAFMEEFQGDGSLSELEAVGGGGDPIGSFEEDLRFGAVGATKGDVTDPIFDPSSSDHLGGLGAADEPLFDPSAGSLDGDLEKEMLSSDFEDDLF